ncbi:MAG: prepilin peptidase [Polyangiaceae bacterium]|nr:prepilin peptidase [Polyangiaceae bacterium]
MMLRELDLSPWIVRLLAFGWGCLWGSFLNVVILRVPRGMSVVRPPSHCPACGAPIHAWDNIPIVSFLVLRGRARCCRARISPKYLVVEVLGGVLSLAVAEHVLSTLADSTPVLHAAAVFLAEAALGLALLAAAFIDAEHMFLPDAITLGGTAFGLATPALRDLGWSDVFAGAALGFAGVWLPFVFLYPKLRGRAGMGMGDAKLVMLAGAWFGIPGAAFALFAGALQATAVALVLLVVRGKIDEPEAVRIERELLEQAAAEGDAEARRELEDDPVGQPPGDGFLAARLPFGPFLCLATIEWMLVGDRVRAIAWP